MIYIHEIRSQNSRGTDRAPYMRTIYISFRYRTRATTSHNNYLFTIETLLCRDRSDGEAAARVPNPPAEESSTDGREEVGIVRSGEAGKNGQSIRYQHQNNNFDKLQRVINLDAL